MDRVEALLSEREAEGLMRQYEIAAALALICAVVVYFSTYDPAQRLVVTAAFVVPLVASAAAWLLLRTRRLVVPVGFAFGPVTMALLAFIATMAYRAADPDVVSASYLPKSAQAVVPA